MALIIDVETSGLPQRGNLRFGQFPSYDDLLSYEDARVVQVTMMLCNEQLEEIYLNDFIVKSDGFKISNSSFHGITDEISETKGTSFLEIAEIFLENLKQVSYVIAHNANFDISILKSELYRYQLYSIIEELNKKQIFCTMKKTMMIVKSRFKNGGIKSPSLAELYMFVFNKNIENAHNSKYDVINLHDIVKNMYDSKQLSFDKLLVTQPTVVEITV